MLNIDVDGLYRRPRFEKQRILYSMPRPFFLRLSSSRRGLHISVPACGEWDWRRFAYDDPMRINLDEQRQRKGIAVHNLLWDVKNGKHAGQWWIIRTEQDIERFLDRYKRDKIYHIKRDTNIYANIHEGKKAKDPPARAARLRPVSGLPKALCRSAIFPRPSELLLLREDMQ